MTKDGLSKKRESQLMDAVKSIITNDDFFTHASNTKQFDHFYNKSKLQESFKQLRPYHPSVWGPAGWTFLQGCILSLPCSLTEDQILQFRVFLAFFAKFLPCPDCRKHFSAAIRTMPRSKSMHSRVGLLAWLVETHSKVRSHQGKRILTASEIIDLSKTKEQNPAMSTNSCTKRYSLKAVDSPNSRQYTFSLFWLVLIAGAFILIGLILGQVRPRRN